MMRATVLLGTVEPPNSRKPCILHMESMENADGA